MRVRRVLGTTNRDIVNALCSDIIANSYDKNYISFSDDVYLAFKVMKDYNYKDIYDCALIAEQKRRFGRMVADLFKIYLNALNRADAKQSIFVDYISHLPDSYLKENENERIIADYLASMTDQYFLKQYELRFMPRMVDYDQINLLGKINADG
jgi:dGTPase